MQQHLWIWRTSGTSAFPNSSPDQQPARIAQLFPHTAMLGFTVLSFFSQIPQKSVAGSFPSPPPGSGAAPCPPSASLAVSNKQRPRPTLQRRNKSNLGH